MGINYLNTLKFIIYIFIIYIYYETKNKNLIRLTCLNLLKTINLKSLKRFL